ncbi:putative membrane protein [Wickerhamomyces ciferrii]|uniref:Membrane protein n=1 Tax=Wickerhamomyces ciferrii (strain ATCC 14091 / BCRC 22168 / CBS 111 / JCM 3599 / NBRC 0793 / NRRL Y-1031 F-60-10) TaxID=1206466 RepID=K0KLP7_WICCF|nr:uncharacterized protein BN7_2689 [Wickerhamomyces ciferrii]CCH43142.1 putative membrane protein [Wickerhamomyces ciferrii]
MDFQSLRPWAASLQRFQGYIRVPDVSFSDFTNNQDSLSPSKITIQILILQFFYYIIATIFSFSIAWILGLDFSLDWVFNWNSVSLDNTLGLTMIGLWLFDSLLCVIFMTVIVGRSKLAWDFALTIHLINLIIVWIYSGSFPGNLVWWIVQILSCIILVSLGTWSTRWKELRETFFEGLVDPELGNGVGNQRPVIEMQDHS